MWTKNALVGKFLSLLINNVPDMSGARVNCIGADLNSQRAVTSHLPKHQENEQRIDPVVRRNDTFQIENTRS